MNDKIETKYFLSNGYVTTSYNDNSIKVTYHYKDKRNRRTKKEYILSEGNFKNGVYLQKLPSE